MYNDATNNYLSWSGDLFTPPAAQTNLLPFDTNNEEEMVFGTTTFTPLSRDPSYETVPSEPDQLFIAPQPFVVSQSTMSKKNLHQLVDSVPLTKEKLYSLFKQRCITQARDKANRQFFRRMRKYEAAHLQINDPSDQYVIYDDDYKLDQMKPVNAENTTLWCPETKNVKQYELTTSIFYLNFEFKRGINLRWKLFDLDATVIERLANTKFVPKLFRISVADYAASWPLDKAQCHFKDAPFEIEHFHIDLEQKTVETLIRIKTDKGTKQNNAYRIGGTGSNGIMLGMIVQAENSDDHFFLEPVLCSRNFKMERKKKKDHDELDQSNVDTSDSSSGSSPIQQLEYQTELISPSTSMDEHAFQTAIQNSKKQKMTGQVLQNDVNPFAFSNSLPFDSGYNWDFSRV